MPFSSFSYSLTNFQTPIWFPKIFLPFHPSLTPQLRGFGRCPWLKARSRAILTVLSMLVRFLRRRPMESGLLMLLQ
jgi:hypothetical protein